MPNFYTLDSKNQVEQIRTCIAVMLQSSPVNQQEIPITLNKKLYSAIFNPYIPSRLVSSHIYLAKCRSSSAGNSSSSTNMEKKSRKTFPTMLVIFLFFILAFVSSASQAITEKSSLDTYIVLLQKPEGISTDSEDLDAFYQSFLPAPASTQSSNRQRLIFSYRNVVTGFAAKLTAEEAKAMEEKKGFVSARPEKVLPLHTTHTPSFLGLQRNFGVWNHSKYGKGVIIGLLDTGIYPEHPSFSDVGMPPPPAKWKGKCEFNGTACNNKIIGARNFISKEPPWDYFGHGTHTSSTAAGSPVPGANYFGQVNGTATGLAPLAHLAMYKVCSDGCGESAILAAMDAAVEDGVDILSLSLGGGSSPFYDDVIALGAFGATQKGVFVSCSAGNSGPFTKSLSNEAPWILTVGASTVDREIRATVLLGNRGELNGQSLFQPKDFPSALLPLVYAGSNGDQSLAWCAPGSLKNIDVKGKIVLCERGGNIARLQKGQEVKNNGGAAMILMNDELNGYVTIADPHVLPASHVSYKAGLDIQTYINSTSSPMATISFRGTVLGVPDAPQIASFSSRGPSLASPGILKPDVIGPGVDILAAWPYSYDNNSDDPSTKFNMISGTSMSCPHLSGVAALLKSIYPDWSPAAIKSAIVTTTDIYNIGGSIITDQQFVAGTFFDMGAGHVNPARASRPGVVYDIQPDDYIPYLCGLGYSDKQVGVILQRSVNCSSISSIPEAELNYPSFSIRLGLLPLTYTRTLTNVGEPNSVYTAKVVMSAGVDVKIAPGSISFTGVNQKATFSVTFGKNANATGSFAEGYLYWFSDQHGIRTPIAVLFD